MRKRSPDSVGTFASMGVEAMKVPRITIRRLMLLVAIVAGLIYCLVLLTSYKPTHILLSTLLGHDTIYAPSFSEHKFRRIRPGMSLQDVLETIGSPLGKSEYPGDGREYWTYSKSSSGRRHHWGYSILFLDGRVLSVDSDFYLD